MYVMYVVAALTFQFQWQLFVCTLFFRVNFGISSRFFNNNVLL